MLRLATVAFILMLTALSAAASDGIAAFENHQFPEARTALQHELKGDPRNARLHQYLGRTWLALDDARAAAAALDQAATIEPDNPDTLAWLGEAHGTLAANASIFRAGGHAKRSLAAFENALKLEPRHEDALEGLIVFKLNAPRLVGGSRKEALALTDRLASVNPVRGALRRAQVFDNLDRRGDARAELEQLAATRPDDGRAQVQLGFMAQEDEQYAKAMTHFRAAAQAPGVQREHVVARQMAWYQLGRTAVFADDFQRDGIDGLSRYIAVEQLDPTLPGKDWAHFRLGELLVATGQSGQAKLHFETALRLTDDDNLRRRASANL